MMKSVQVQKIQQTIQLLCKCYHQKNQFMSQNIPLQQQLIKRIQDTAELSLTCLVDISIVLKQERQCNEAQYLSYEKLLLANRDKYKVTQKKNPNQDFKEFSSGDWNRNMTRVLEAMSISHVAKINALKLYHKLIDSCFQQISRQQISYRSQIKFIIKQLKIGFEKIDQNEKQQNKILTKLVKQCKNKQKQSIYYLTQVKKAENYMYKQFQFFIQRNKKILQFVKIIVKNQKKSSKKIKQILTILFDKRKEIIKQTSEDQKILGLLTVIQDGVQQARQLYLQKTLISPQLQQKISRVVQPQKSKIHHMIKYLSLQTTQYQKKYTFFAQISALSAQICFKYFDGISLAQGWLITTFTPSIAYLTFDHYLAIYDKNGILIKKIHAPSSKINKVTQNNVVFLQQIKKGIFTDSKQQYQIKFDNSDRMEQFILFIENQIS